MLNKIGESLFSVSGKISDFIRAGKAKSLTEFSQSAHILPIFLMDDGVATMAEAESIVGGTLNYYAACYLMAAQMSVNIGEINVISQLERLNNRRSPLSSAAGTIDTLFHMESYSNGLPNVKKLGGFHLESKDSDEMFYEGSSSMTAKDQVSRVEAAPKLSIGKIMEINWESNGQRGTIVTLVRPAVQTTNSTSMANILSIGSKNIEYKERIHGIKAGTLHWFNDGIMVADILKEMRRARIKDNTGYYNDAVARHRKNKISSILSLNPSVAQLSSVFFITKETARNLENTSNIKLDKFKDRQKMFENSFGMVLVVVDKSWKSCRIYSHGLEDYTDVSFSQLEGVSKGKSGDVKEMFNALMLSSAPSF